MDDGLNEGNTCVARERREARPDDGPAGDLPILLGHIPARAQPAAACHDDGCDTRSHVLPHSQIWWDMALARRGRGANGAGAGSILDCDFCAAALANWSPLAKLYAAETRSLIHVQGP